MSANPVPPEQRKKVFEEEIKPLMAKINDIAMKNGIQFAAVFQPVPAGHPANTSRVWAYATGEGTECVLVKIINAIQQGCTCQRKVGVVSSKRGQA